MHTAGMVRALMQAASQPPYPPASTGFVMPMSDNSNTLHLVLWGLFVAAGALTQHIVPTSSQPACLAPTCFPLYRHAPPSSALISARPTSSSAPLCMHASHSQPACPALVSRLHTHLSSLCTSACPPVQCVFAVLPWWFASQGAHHSSGRGIAPLIPSWSRA